MCFNKVACSSRHDHWRKSLNFRKKKGEEVLERLRKQEQEIEFFRSADLILERELVNEKEIRQVIDMGWVVDAQRYYVVILGYVITNKNHVPIHVKLIKSDEGDWYISNAYYPTQERWGKDYNDRICFCIENRSRKGFG